MTRALLLIDIQNDYFPGGAMALVGSPEAGLQAGGLLTAFRAQRLPVIHIQHLALRPGATFFLPGTPGAEIHPGVAPLPGEPVFQKHFPNSFRETPLLEHLRGLGATELVVAGMMTHMCIDTTVRAAFDLGFTCHLAGDACATRDLGRNGATTPAAQVQAAFLAALHGTFAQVQSTEELLAGL
ncbi:MAG: cysteine hydrolase [Geothrix sp.]|uniref:cysteine hydrolase family protein n=1 Tax=Geothrix sp. TaxID=1962974 RepID=UPI00184E7F6C|nr:cysteine hydrolase family protein [Geothrix sp.]NWJ40634.1 cysteine hydrolase [Geothrix sp.]WIL21357.1 MAG: cysteine hydrolase [Geothrix sp.]